MVQDCVILLHGAGRSIISMNRIARALLRQDYRVYNLGYPSRRAPIEKLAHHISGQIAQIWFDPKCSIHFVTHSLGGIVLRYYLKIERVPNLGRVVMLAPPNQGAELADIFASFSLYRWILGPIGAQIGTTPDSLPNSLGAVDYEVGVIAGNRSFNPLLSALIPGPDDGRISVERTKLMGMQDFLVLPCVHPLIMNCASVIQQTIHFLQQGWFKHSRTN